MKFFLHQLPHCWCWWFPQMWGVKKSANFTAEVFRHLKKDMRTTALDIRAGNMENEDSSAEIIMGFVSLCQAVFIQTKNVNGINVKSRPKN